MKLFRVLIAASAALALTMSLAAATPSAATPAAPIGVTGIALSASVGLAWQAVPGVDGYTVYRGTSATAITTRLTAATGITVTSYTDTTAVNGTTYYYVVRSISGGVESANSLTVQSKPVSRACSTGNAVVLENCYPGNTGWKVVDPEAISGGGIEGFATSQSINKGDSVNLKVNADDGATFRIEIYRTGYYGGLGSRLFSVIRDVPAVRQPGCQTSDTTGLLDCSNWSTSATITTTSAWPSGVYLLRLVRTDTNTDFHVLLVVRDDSRAANLLYGVSFSTFEAYNNYGGKSLYDFNSTGANTVAGTPRAVKVSFDRPFEQSRNGLRDWYPEDEFASVYWLEESGYDVQYISNTDLETQPSLALGHKAYLSPAHDEYWSGGMRTAVTAARDAGVNLFFSGSNEVYWKIRYENGPNGGTNRVQVCYKTIQGGAADPVTPTTTWRDPSGPNQPENALSGEMYIGDNDLTYFPLVVSASQGTDRIYRDTALSAQAPGTSTTLGQNLVGWEWDARVNNGFEPAGVKTLSGSPVTGELIQGNGASLTPLTATATASMVKYTAPSGALVVATGTNHWNRGLALNADGVGEPLVTIQQITTNILEDMGVVPQTPAANITLDVAANRPAAPTGTTAVSGGTDQVSVSWNAVAGATYNVYRTTASRDGGQPLGALANGSPLTTTSFTDTGLSSATNYYYVVTSVVNGVQSLASNEASVITAASAGQPTRIDVGASDDYTSSTGANFRADSFFSGGLLNASTHAITGTPDPTLYQTERYGQFTYSVPVANGTYDVRLHFVELYYGTVVPGGVGKRVFSIDIGNTPVSPDLPNIDVYSLVGPNAALVKTVTGVNVMNGVLDIHSVSGAADDPELAAIEIIPESIPPSATSTSPLDGATSVGRLTQPQAAFSRAMDPTTITPSTFTLTGPSGAVAGTVSYDANSTTAMFSPTAALSYSTTYTAKISTAAKADDGTAFAAPFSWTFTTQAPVPPTVTSTFPSNGATGLSPAVLPDAVFSRSLDPTTVTTSTFSLKTSAGVAVPATVAYTDGSRTATLTPTAPLASSTTYNATLSTGIKAVDGVALAAPVTWSFTTSASNPVAPTVTAQSPAPGTTNVAISTSIAATFSRAMYANGITLTTFTLSGPSGTVAATVSYNASTLTATLAPSSPLVPGTTYTARLDPAVVAADGTPLAAAVSWSFTTMPPPTATTLSPAAGSGYVARATAVSVTFSRAMNAATLTSNSFVLNGPNGAVPATVAYNAASFTATLTPAGLFDGGTTYNALVATTVTAADGTPLTAPVAWSFSTAACPCSLFSPALTPDTVGNSTQDGRTGVGPFTYEFGVKVVVDEPMKVTALRFYKSPGETGTHTGNIWTSGGVIIGSTTFTNETASGWQQQSLASPITLQSGSTYVLSVNANSMFVSTGGALLAPVVAGPIRTVADGLDGVFGVAAGQFPTQSYNSSNYFIDLAAVPSPDPAPPTVVPVAPLSGATGVGRSATVVGSFSRSMTPSTINSTTVTLSNSIGVPVPATVAYNDTGHQFTLTPNAPLPYSTTYTVHISTGARATDGMSLGSATAWSFTTADPVPVTVVSTLPISGAGDVGGSVKPRATFSKALNASTISTNTFTLAGPSGGVAGTVSYDPVSFQATFTPNAALAPGSYTARLDSSITATDDATMATPFAWSFSVPASIPPPSVTTMSPASGATAILRSTTVTAAFSRSMDPATLTSSTFTLSGPSGAVAATVTYDGPSQVATLTPNSLLTSNTTYTATVTTGAKAADGTSPTAATTWSFTTAACPCTLFSPVLTPALTGLSTQDGRSGVGPFTYELGVKVSVTQAMLLTSIRFYKDAGETGTHIGRVWTSTGTQLASATFSNETASGWQQQALSSPLLLQPNVVYVVSINANATFVATGGGLLTQVTSGPMHSVADGLNGVFATTGGTFPNQSYNSTNYFVDATVQPNVVAPPTVTATSPVAGATGVSRSTAVSASFSRSMDPTSLTASTFTVTGASGAVSGTISYDDPSHTATFVPSAPLAYSTVYTAKLTTAARAADGVFLASAVQWSFTIAAPVPPTVTSTLPVNGALDIGPAVAPRANFSKPIDPTTLTASTFTLTGPAGAVAGTVSYVSSSQTAVFTPSASLAAGAYTARLKAAITTTDQVALGTDYTWTFTVATALPAPAVTSTSPSSGATGVSRSVQVTATFNRSLNPATVTSNTFDLRTAGGTLVPATVTYNSATLTATLVPSAQLASSAVYTAEVSSGIQAGDGTAVTPASWSFTTAPCPCSLFASTAAPASTGNSTVDGRSGAGPFTYELGVKITVDSAVQLTAVRFYKDPLETGTHVARIWSATGTLLGSVPFSSETASGWQQQALSTPISLQAGTTYVVSVGYNAFFGLTGAGLATQVSTGPLHSVADGANGVFANSAGVFPTLSWNSGNYFVDVVVQ
jgi:hypothetical protein